MKKTFGLLLLLTAALVSCDENEEAVSPDCDVVATVVDLRGLDGCGFVFELEDGTRLEPVRVFYCGTEPMPEIPADPLHTFDFAAGKKVKISYDISQEIGSICMAGTPAKITCLTELTTGGEDSQP
ncbi:MAG TPA: hypothetical protein VGD40_15255 [Chryseosolibacter sp.]